MSILTIEDKIELIAGLCAKHDITAYEIGKETGLSTSGVQRILNNEVKKPRNETLNTILEYVESRLAGTDTDNQEITAPTEPSTHYISIDDIINKKIKNSEAKSNKKIDDLSIIILKMKKEIEDLSKKLNFTQKN